MRRAFTLIELLVVIAIIAILAAILFPVFAQAKTAAKKASQISNTKQLGIGVMLYMGDSDDLYPRQDDCVDKSSLNPVLNTRAFAPNGVGCVTAPFFYRTNHFSWQKWVRPYTKNVDIFKHSARPPIDLNTSSCPQGVWSSCGQLGGSMAINLALTGALNTYGDPNRNGANRQSFLGGNQSSIPDNAAAWLLMELFNADVTFAPVFTTPSNVRDQTAWPVAIRELWIPNFMKATTGTCAYTNEIDPSKYPFGSTIILGMADSSTKAMNIRQFLSNTPTQNDYRVNSRWACTFTGGAWTITSAPTYTGSWPMWALQ